MIPDLNGVPAGRIEMHMPVRTARGTQVTARGTWILAVSSGQVLELTLMCEQSSHAQYRPFFEATIRSFIVFTP